MILTINRKVLDHPIHSTRSGKVRNNQLLTSTFIFACVTEYCAWNRDKSTGYDRKWLPLGFREEVGCSFVKMSACSAGSGFSALWAAFYSN